MIVASSHWQIEIQSLQNYKTGSFIARNATIKPKRFMFMGYEYTLGPN